MPVASVRGRFHTIFSRAVITLVLTSTEPLAGAFQRTEQQRQTHRPRKHTRPTLLPGLVARKRVPDKYLTPSCPRSPFPHLRVAARPTAGFDGQPCWPVGRVERFEAATNYITRACNAYICTVCAWSMDASRRRRARRPSLNDDKTVRRRAPHPLSRCPPFTLRTVLPCTSVRAPRVGGLPRARHRSSDGARRSAVLRHSPPFKMRRRVIKAANTPHAPSPNLARAHFDHILLRGPATTARVFLGADAVCAVCLSFWCFP